MDNSSHTEIYKSYIIQQGKKHYTFQRVNKSSNGPDLAIIVQNNGDNDKYNVAQIVNHKMERSKNEFTNLILIKFLL